MVNGLYTADDPYSHLNLSECNPLAASAFESMQATLSIEITPSIMGFIERQEYIVTTKCILSNFNAHYNSIRELTAMASVYVEPIASPSTAIFPLYLNLIDFDPGTGMYILDIQLPPLLCSHWPLYATDSVFWAASKWNGSTFLDMNSSDVFSEPSMQPGVVRLNAHALVKSSIFRVRQTQTHHQAQIEFRDPAAEILTSSTSTFIFSTGSTFGSAVLVAAPMTGLAFKTVFKLCVPEFSAVTTDGIQFRFGFGGQHCDVMFRDGAWLGEPCASAVLPPGNVTVWADIMSVYRDIVLVNCSISVAEPTQAPTFEDVKQQL